ncbi:ABC transporter ATP-binding protein [Arthrobacter sp. StoSoilB5]|uniref:ABC transporter ATP-binding protein n=1 Tax=Arthrobacter sp. StoSoilB5 TaxID=2830992 RepID=UPI001CC6C5BB|nr:ABC transporter ATP-binding protein [Arthrobacter sp. StoSoilB5]BCW44744.1 ABC transporter [Arthrobacter sp. StoSoilB5]
MITFSDIRVEFPGFVALPSFNMEIEEGEFFTLLGPSGCGKTTALRTLAGLIDPTSGTITIDGRDVTRARSDQRQLGMVFQNYALFPSMNVGENIAFGLRTKRLTPKEIRSKVAEVAATVDLRPEQLDKSISDLSGGQQQRVAIARSLAPNPRLLLLDEPLSNLDAKLRQQLRVQLKDLQQRVGITTVYVTHDQDEALAMSDRIAVMNAGKIEQLGTPEEIYSHSATEFVCTFIGEANRLSHALLERMRDAAAPLLDPSRNSYLRSEKVRFVEPGEPDNGFTVAGTIERRSYFGANSEYVIDLGAAGTIRARVLDDGDSRRAAGDAVKVRLHVEDVLQYDQSGARVMYSRVAS